MRDAGHRTPDGEKSKNNISTPQGGGHNYYVGYHITYAMDVNILQCSGHKISI